MSEQTRTLIIETVVQCLKHIESAEPQPPVWCAIKLENQFPNNIRQNDDLDIVCGSIEHCHEFERILLKIGTPIVQKNNWSLRRTNTVNGHWHVDMQDTNHGLLFRFDLLVHFEKAYTRFNVSKEYANHIITNRVYRQCRDDLSIPVPCKSDDFALRYMEFVQYANNNRGKRKHLNHILKQNTVVFRRVALEHPKYANIYDENDVIDGKILKDRMRLDAFIVWPNGTENLREICCLIRDNPFLHIRYVKRREITTANGMADFVKKVYENDNVAAQHLAEKTRYLTKSATLNHTERSVYLIVVENRNPATQINGSGKWAVEQSKTITNCKIVIRSAFNPPFENANHRVAPLPPGVSHQHVVHASDKETDVFYMCNLFECDLNVHQLKQYLADGSAAMHLPFHLRHHKNTLVQASTKRVTLDSLRVSLATKDDKNRIQIVQKPISATPHYFFASKEDRMQYEEYHKEFCGICFTEDHFPEAFDFLRLFFDLSRAEPLICNKDMVILDGAHRAAILAALGKTHVDILIV